MSDAYTPGDRVRCVLTDELFSMIDLSDELTRGKTYEPLKVQTYHVCVTNDEGVRTWYDKRRFAPEPRVPAYE